MQLAVVGAYPQHIFLNRTGRNAQNGAVVFGIGGIKSQAAAFAGFLAGGVVGGEVGADDVPRITAIGRFMNKLRAVIDCFWIKRISGNARVPVVAQIKVGGVNWFHKLRVARYQVVAAQSTALRHGPTVAWIGAVGNYVETVAKVEFFPIFGANAAVAPNGTGATPRAVVLHSAVQIKRRFHVHIDVVELTHGQVVHKSPSFALIAGNHQATVVARHYKVGVLRVNPKSVVIGVNPRKRNGYFEITTAVFAG